MRTLALLLSFALFAPPSTPEERGAQQVADLEAWQQGMFDKIAPAVVFISTKDGHGSGFFVSSDGWILTSAHVVGKAKKVDVVLRDGTRHRAEVRELARDNIDFALLKIDIANAPRLEFASTRDMKVGTWVGSVGHGTGGIWTFNKGMISNIYPVGTQRPVFQTDIPLNPGNSGGPIFDRHSRVVGVVTAGVTGANNVNYGIQIDVALANLDSLGEHCKCFVFKAPKNVAVFLDGQSIGSGPRIAVPATDGNHKAFVIIDGKKHERSISWPTEREIVFP